MTLRSLAAVLLVAGSALAYYPFVRYNTRSAPFVPVPAKFDLNALSRKTVQYFIAESGPTQLLPGDSFASLQSQIRAAAKVWSEVETSELNLTYGGLRPAGQPPGATPSIDVVFDDLPPGVLSQSGPVTVDDEGLASSQSFVPIRRSVIVLARNFQAVPSPCPCPSWSEPFFLTLVHEFGHAIGLQHSFSSGAMSTYLTRGTTKAKPLAQDDIAGVSALYPTRGHAANFGSITGRVTSGAAGIGYATVVALAPSGAIVNAVTNPDGFYRLDGVPPGQYLVYAQPLPPAAFGEDFQGGLVPALDADRRGIGFPGYFDTVFFPGTREPAGAAPLAIRAGVTTEGINFAVNRRSTAPAIHAVQTYSFPQQVAVRPGYVNAAGGPRNFLVIFGNGLINNNQVAPGLQVRVLGGSAAVASARLYPQDNRFLQVDLAVNPFANEGSNHLVFSTPSETHVLPAAFALAQRPAPIVAGAAFGSDNGARILTISGTGFVAGSQVLLDGLKATVRVVDEAAQRIVVDAPAAAAGHRAAIVVLNPDGQSSAFAQGNNAPTVQFDGGDAGSLIPSSSTIPAGAETLIEITGVNTRFVAGETYLGFGSSDVQVRSLWVLSPTRLLANIAIAPGLTGGLGATVVSGLQNHAAPGALFAGPVGARQFWLSAPSAQSGASATVTVGGNVPAGAPALLLNDRPVQVLAVTGNQITFQTPAGLPPGPAVLRMTVGGDSSLPIAMTIEPPPPQIMAVVNSTGQFVDANRPARPGESVSFIVSGLSDPGAAVHLNRVAVNIAGIDHPAAQLQIVPGAGHQVTVTLNGALPQSVVQATIAIDGRTSAPFAFPIR